MSEQLDMVWKDALGVLRTQLNDQTFKTWFMNIRPVSFSDSLFTISTPNDFSREWLASRYISLVAGALGEATNGPVDVAFVVRPPDETPKIDHKPDPKPVAGSHIRTKYSFDTFVIGSSNRFAHAAALAVAEKPAQSYNPLFIYGGVGLGKTHLLQSIAHYVSSHLQRMTVKYVSSEKFTNDFINSIRDKDKIAGFQRKYRHTDVLLVDDIQFLENKEATQEEFFHTFNTLYEADKQIIISSDRPPKDIATLEARLRTRFESGLIVDIQPPDLETRIAILKKRVMLEDLEISNDVLEFIASNIQSNIRELEGALIRTVAFASLTSNTITKALASEVLRDVFPTNSVKEISISRIQTEVCRYYRLTKAELTGAKRAQPYVLPRQIAMYLSRELTDASLPKIGNAFGNRDHSTVIHATNKIEKLLNQEIELYEQIQELTTKLKSRC